jgi:hypothetical protein
MAYGIDDLSLLRPVLSPEECDGTSYFEFHPAELPAPDAHGLAGSLFLTDVAFDFYAECFYAASASFDYFASQRFDAVDIARLERELDGFVGALRRDPTHATLFSRYSSVFGQEIWSGIDVAVLADAVAATGASLRDFVRAHGGESGCLWVLGM